MHHQMNVADPRPVSHHLDHLELLLLDTAVTRLAEHYITSHTLTTSQREALVEYTTDLGTLIDTLVGPARDYAEHVLELAQTVGDAERDRSLSPAADSAAASAHRAA
jgi:hypothetical protein